MTTKLDPDALEVFRSFAELGPAEVLSRQLTLAEVPTKLESRRLENAIETEYCVLVPHRLAHRARWVVAQLPPSDDELDTLSQEWAHTNKDI